MFDTKKEQVAASRGVPRPAVLGGNVPKVEGRGADARGDGHVGRIRYGQGLAHLAEDRDVGEPHAAKAFTVKHLRQ